MKYLRRTYIQKLSCSECRQVFNPDIWIFRCPRCNAPLEIIYDYDSLREKISKLQFQQRVNNIWRYLELLPIKNPSNIISLNEGWTPLIKSQNLSSILKVKNLYLKDETRNPTWSFKDRGTSVGVSKALELKAKAVCCASTGNMGASMAAYSAKAKMHCIILISKNTPIEKIVQILIHEPTVFLIEEPYPKLYKLVYWLSKNYPIYPIQSDTPQRIEGQKTIAYEICEQLDWQQPDYVIVPTSSGGNISAIWKGFKEFYQLGLIKRLPKMICVQSEGCAPIVEAFLKGESTPKPWPNSNTIAHSISNPNPNLASGKRVLKLLRESEGLALAVSDDEILNAQKMLASKEGIFAEPASAASIAALKKLIDMGAVDRDERIVCIITGSGLKDTKSIVNTLTSPLKVKNAIQFKTLIQKFNFNFL